MSTPGPEPAATRAALEATRLYGIVDLGYALREEIGTVTSQLIEGGAGIIQLRAKKSSEAEILAMAKELAPICRAARVPFVINDFPEIAASVHADIIHVGQDDLPVAEARARAGKGVLVGKSTHSLEQAVAAVEEGADYIGFGPIFSTPTKPEYEPIGPDHIAEVHRLVEIPIFCIGGIKDHNLPDLVAAGARRAVIVSGLLSAENRVEMTRQCLEILS